MFISYSPAEKKRALFFEFRTIIPLENHGFGDRPFLPFEVGRARANAMITLAWLKLTTWFGCGSAVNEPIFAVLNQLANLNGLKGQLINLASILRRTYPWTEKRSGIHESGIHNVRTSNQKNWKNPKSPKYYSVQDPSKSKNRVKTKTRRNMHRPCVTELKWT